VNTEWLDVTVLDLPVRALPPALEGACLVQLSDIHVGPRVRDAYVRDTFARVQAMAPDIVVVTGDLVSLHPGMQRHAAAIYASMPRGRLATVVSFGNHDYGREWNEPAEAEKLRDMLENLGVTVLVNEVATVQGLQVIGLGDLWAGMFDPGRRFCRWRTNGTPAGCSRSTAGGRCTSVVVWARTCRCASTCGRR
jgi:uncharacterized protein